MCIQFSYNFSPKQVAQTNIHPSWRRVTKASKKANVKKWDCSAIQK